MIQSGDLSAAGGGVEGGTAARFAREQSLTAGNIARHWHGRPYAALVLEGSYHEAGLRGRWEIEPGDVVVHQGFEAHQNAVTSRTARVINIPLPIGVHTAGVFAVADPDGLIAAARSYSPEAPELLIYDRSKEPVMRDWADALARELVDPSLRISDWAGRSGLALETVSRGFQHAFGVGPARFRKELQIQGALFDLATTTLSLAIIAAKRGFADQPHLTRNVRDATGMSPGGWRRVKSVQDCPACTN